MPRVHRVSRPASRAACGYQGTRADVPGIGYTAPTGPVGAAQTLDDPPVAHAGNCGFTRGRCTGDVAVCDSPLRGRSARRRRLHEPRPLAHAWTSHGRTVIGPTYGKTVV